MRNLLKAEFSRLFRSRLFRIVIILDVIYSLYTIKDYVMIPEYEDLYGFKDNIWGFILIYGFVSAAFNSLFVSREYSDGTLRNKIVSGHSRKSIYLTELIVCSTAGIILQIVYICIICVLLFKIDLQYIEIGAVIRILIVSFALNIVYNAIFVFSSMLIGSRVSAVVWSITLIMVLFVSAGMLNDAIISDEFHRIDRDNGLEYDEKEILSDNQRKIYTFIYNVIPAGQTIQLEEIHDFTDDDDRETSELSPDERTMRLCLTDISVIAVTTMLGVFFFRKKNLK